MRHFWSSFSQWLDPMPDTRFQPYGVYHRRFLVWWGIGLFLFKLGSRRQLDFDLRSEESYLLGNLNRLAQTHQETLPVHKTRVHFLSHLGWEPLARLRGQMVRRLIRMKVLEPSRLERHLVLAVDATGHLAFSKPHCPHCLVQEHASGQTRYLHEVLEAKLVTGGGLALSLANEFIENADASDATDPEARKQDCESKAFQRLAPQIKNAFPQLLLWVTSDSLYACAPVMRTCEQNHWAYVFTFKSTRLPTVWQEFQALLQLSPQTTRRLEWPDGTVQIYRWIHHLPHEDEQARLHHFNAIQCEQTSPEGSTTLFAWITNLPVTAAHVVEIATKGGRIRSKIENQGFNIQKNSGLNLEHAYSTDPHILKAFYVLLQIAHLLLQLVEQGSLLKHLARQAGKGTALALFGSLKNIARRLLEAFRYFRLPDAAYAPDPPIQIRFNTS